MDFKDQILQSGDRVAKLKDQIATEEGMGEWVRFGEWLMRTVEKVLMFFV